MADDVAGLKSDDHAILVRSWQERIEKAVDHREKFLKRYIEARDFCYDSHDFMYRETPADSADFKASVPKVWEMVSIFGPMLAFRNPHRNCRARIWKTYGHEPDEQMQAHAANRIAFADLLGDQLNYQSRELYLTRQMREAIDESIIGLGVLWLEKDTQTGLWGHFHDSCTNLLIDPDASVIEDAWWIARRHRMPRWEFAEMAKVAIDSDDLPKANMSEDAVKRSVKVSDIADRSMSGLTNDLIEVWEIWSRMGIGWKGKGINPDETKRPGARNDPPNVHFYHVPSSKRIWLKAKWPVPLHLDNEWPCELIYYRKDRHYVYPVPLIQPSLALQKAINWLVTMTMQKIKVTSRDFIAHLAELTPEIVEQIQNGMDLGLLPIPGTEVQQWGGIDKMVAFLQAPPMNKDIPMLMDIFGRMFEQSSGLLPVLYAQAGDAQSRSATESNIRKRQADVRPDDMREVVERAHSRMARKEAIASRLDYTADFIGNIHGPIAAQVWGEYKKGDLRKIMREFEYVIEAGSAAKPNLDEERQQALELFDREMQVALGFQDLNAANKIIRRLERSMAMLPQDQIQIQPPPPPPGAKEPDTAESVEAQEQEKAGAEGEKRRAQAAKAEEAEAKARVAKLQEAAEAIKIIGQNGGTLPGPPGDVSEIRGGKAVRS